MYVMLSTYFRSHSIRRHCEPGVFLVAAVLLSWNLWDIRIASGDIDPVSHFGAMDEPVYTREAITMARSGGWMTPTFLGRWIFEKPPLLVWLSALSMKLFGIGRFSARLPAVLSGSLVCALCFAIVRKEKSEAAGLLAAAMVLSSGILFTMARHNMTNILLAAASVCAIASVQRRCWTGFCAAACSGILAKSIAGLLPIASIAIWVAQRDWKVAVRAARAGAGAVAIASFWFLYCLLVHRNWFLADSGFQLITTGFRTHPGIPSDHFGFYLWRILNSDPVMIALLVLALPAIASALGKRDSMAVLLAGGALIHFAALMAFRYPSEQYLTWFVPWLILPGALYSPLAHGRRAGVAAAVCWRSLPTERSARVIIVRMTQLRRRRCWRITVARIVRPICTFSMPATISIARFCRSTGCDTDLSSPMVSAGGTIRILPIWESCSPPRSSPE
jgi:4-amino-4-deoxy-L-arabinose transferase-like glycosyltransferase